MTLRRIIAQGRALKSDTEVREAIAMWSATPREQREQRLFEVLNAIYATAEGSAGQEVIPDLGLLVVDEAHQLEDSFALVLSRTVSIWSLRRDVKALQQEHPRVVKASDMQAIDAVWGRLRAIGDVDAAMLGDELKDVVKTLGESLNAVTERKGRGLVGSAAWRRVQVLANSLRVSMLAYGTGEGFTEVMVTWSPDRMWPQLTIGRLSYARELHYLWTNIAQRAILVSGTLYEELPQLSCEAVRRALSVPFDSLATMEPVHAMWQQAPVTVCMVGNLSSPGGRPRFLRPRQKEDSQEAALDSQVLHSDWCRDVAGYMLEAHREGAGEDTVVAALKADAHRPKEHRRTARALFAQIQAQGYQGGYTALTNFIRVWREQSGKEPQRAFVPLSFELGEAFQFDWGEEGIVVGGVYYQAQVSHLKLCASRAFWLVAYPSQGHEMLFDAHTPVC